MKEGHVWPSVLQFFISYFRTNLQMICETESSPFCSFRTNGCGLSVRRWIRCSVVVVKGHRRGRWECPAQPPTLSPEKDGLKMPNTTAAGCPDGFMAGKRVSSGPVAQRATWSTSWGAQSGYNYRKINSQQVTKSKVFLLTYGQTFKYLFPRGTLRWPDGRTYCGNFKNGFEDGWGQHDTHAEL